MVCNWHTLMYSLKSYRILPELHSLTGRDTTSRLSSKINYSKVTSLDFVQKALRHFAFGEHWRRPTFTSGHFRLI